MVERLSFWKMHGLGNDYIVIDNMDDRIRSREMPELAMRLCRRRFSVGADGLIFACPSKNADVRMRIFNPDGSEAEMCGNGIRCLAKFCYENHIVTKKSFTVETLAGTRNVWLTINSSDMEVASVKVDMGEPAFNREAIPMLGTGTFINEELKVNGTNFRATCLSVGNPHCVIFVEDVENVPLSQLGPLIENHELFPRRVNVEFVQIISPVEIKVRVWERGVGETLACGTGACASVVAGCKLGKTGSRVKVNLSGGTLTVHYDGRIFMDGPAVKVFAGTLF
ncbi:MAG: diaminopimelate epimerase [Candidatus Bathyarchaeota archaeon]|nr:diaminopimelate epimerase [Candidatus Bathyarchaeota archaeon]